VVDFVLNVAIESEILYAALCPLLLPQLGPYYYYYYFTTITTILLLLPSPMTLECFVCCRFL